jgi:hypothetical protein
MAYVPYRVDWNNKKVLCDKKFLKAAIIPSSEEFQTMKELQAAYQGYSFVERSVSPRKAVKKPSISKEDLVKMIEENGTEEQKKELSKWYTKEKDGSIRMAKDKDGKTLNYMKFQAAVNEVFK